MGTTKIRGGVQVIDDTITLDDLDFSVPVDFPDLGDTPANYTAASGLYVKVTDVEDGLEFSAVPGGVTDHGELTGLADDDHEQYLLADGSRAISGDLYTVPWTPWQDSSTIVGWASFLAKKIYYKKIGKTVFVQFEIAGTSGGTNGAIVTFTLPFSQSVLSGSLTVVSRIMNNGTYSNSGHFVLNPNSTVLSVYRNSTSSAWTTTGSKRVYGSFRYETN